ncbi:MAG: RHS repeat-associated core domain-containing protein [Sphingobacteriales bacterium]|nr:MAG: RHS repeat-associated core domain-containing protein [Sphingobacteriales bacterium]
MRYLYGSGRVGVIHNENKLTGTPGFKIVDFEITDYLGNVRATVEHRPGQQGHPEPIVKSYSNHYAFGAPHPDRLYNALDVRHGFNGKEKHDEFMGVGKLINFGARMYDPITGRWWARDPLGAKMPGWSSYSFSFNNPILFIDPDGEYPVITITKQKAGSALQRVIGFTGSRKEQYTKVDLYKVVVTDTEDRNFKMSFTVTRDALAVRKGDAKNGRMVMTNVAFEPKDGRINHYTGKPIVYPVNDGTKALKLTQYSSEVIHAEPNNASVELGYRTKADVAAGIMIHVGGVYEHADGSTSCAASEGCFGITDGNSSDENPSNEYSNGILTTIVKKANQSKTNKGKIEVVIEKRDESERVETKTEKQQ